jgi:hypothetical protein
LIFFGEGGWLADGSAILAWAQDLESSDLVARLQLLTLHFPKLRHTATSTSSSLSIIVKYYPHQFRLFSLLFSFRHFKRDVVLDRLKMIALGEIVLARRRV